VAKKKPEQFEDHINTVDAELEKRRGRWFLQSIAWIDFDDVKQIIRFHLYLKWEQWDQKRALKPWLNRIISNQLKNILRNYYGNFARPCLSCPFNQSPNDDPSANPKGIGELCGFTPSGMQCSECPLFEKWEKTKKSAHDIKMPLALENHQHDLKSDSGRDFAIDKAAGLLHGEMKKVLSRRQYEIYEMLFVKNMSDEEIAIKMGYKTSESGRKAGYKQLKNMKKQFKAKAEKILKNTDIIM
tara:strand:+ start:585 stop:1310 length:726 start_codon:yes stop_codon:yes gene_type:complete